ncbi:MAG TPA: hypothetical protein H9821_00260, partial [Candidatus Rothia avicola]|nr:hypothetical protein [Candidatus Rothia avicola]
MIQSLNNFSKKSWDNYSTENDFFNSRNIVFGKNGMGKTALGQGIIEEYTKKGGDKFRYYSENYHDNSIIISERNGIKGVKADFGREAVENIKTIQNLTNKIVPEGKLDKLEEIPEHSLKVTLRTIFDQNKGNVRVNFPSSKNAEEIISIFKKQFEEAKLEKSIVEIDNFIPDSSNYEQERDNLRALDIPKYSDCEDLIVALQNLKSIELK